jgi:hypothetical protein
MQQPEKETETDFATEHESPGFKTAFPLRPAATEGAGPLENFDSDDRYERYPPTWERIKRAARRAWERVHH